MQKAGVVLDPSRMALAVVLRHFAKAQLHFGRVVPEIDPDLELGVENMTIHPKKIRTRRNIGMSRLPALLEVAAQAKINKVADKSFRAEAKLLSKILYHQKLPDDSHTLKLKKAEILDELNFRGKISQDPSYEADEFKLDEARDLAQYQLKIRILGALENRRRDWHYYEYDDRAACLYMATRLAANYASVKTVMDEIKACDEDFNPKSILDFGSGLGTTIWAVNETWPDNAMDREFTNVDISKEQQHLCDYLLRGGKEIGDIIPNVLHKQYLPTSDKVKYDMVVAAFTMLELPNMESRVNAIENLWNKTNDLLVLIERGTKGGFTTVNEARNLVLDANDHQVTWKVPMTYQSMPAKRPSKIPQAHILAPCSHEYICPRLSFYGKKKPDVCRFRTSFEPMEIGQRKQGTMSEEFSYIVLRKRPHPLYMGEYSPRWPRIVEPRKGKGGLKVFKACCPNGGICEIVFTKKRYGKAAYKIASAADWGDLLPVKVRDTYTRETPLIDKKTLEIPHDSDLDGVSDDTSTNKSHE